MIPKPTDNILETNSTGKTIKLRINANKSLFDLLSNNIYSDPEDSVVRELISNAVDAQARNGNSDKPLTIIVHNELIVEDHGTGMTPEKFENVYAVYGNSDKLETNDEIGQFGIGAKSAFSIADQFVVETIPGDGNKYVYIVYKDLSGSGEINLTSVVETSEPTGTKVRVPIRSEIYDAIKTAVCKYTYFLKPYPVLHFKDNFLPDQPNFYLDEDDYVVPFSNPYAGIYNILYDGWMPYRIRSMSGTVGLIKFAKDELELAASRESVKETPEVNTIFKLKRAKLIEKYHQQTVDDIMKLKDAESIINKANEFISLSHRYIGTNKNIKVEIKNHPKYGDFEWPPELNEQIFCVEFRRGNFKSYGATFYNTTSKKTLLYLPDTHWSKLESPYYKQKIRKAWEQGTSCIFVLTENQYKNFSHPLLKEIFQTAKNLLDVKLDRNYTSTKCPKGHVGVNMKNGGKTYVPLDSGVYVYKKKDEEWPYIPNTTVCEVGKRALKKITGLKNWMTPKDYIKEQIDKFDSDEIRNVVMSLEVKHLPPHLKAILNDGFNLIEYDKNIVSKYTEDQLALIRQGISYRVIDKKTQELTDIIYNKYPMLQFVDYWTMQHDESKKSVFDYILLVEEKNATSNTNKEQSDSNN